MYGIKKWIYLQSRLSTCLKLQDAGIHGADVLTWVLMTVMLTADWRGTTSQLHREKHKKRSGVLTSGSG